MAQKLDLGHSTLRIRNSKLQLHLAASAYFTQPPSHGSLQIELPELENLESVWITEAPELELRFFVGGDWDGTEMTAFVSRLSSRLCNMEVCVRECFLNHRLTIPCSRSGRIWDSQLSPRRLHLDIVLTLLVSTTSDLACAENVEYGTTQRVGLCLVQ